MTYFTCAAFGVLIVRYHTNNIYAKIKCAAGPSSDLAVGRGLAPGILARSALLVATFPRGGGRADRAGRGRNAEDSVPYEMAITLH